MRRFLIAALLMTVLALLYVFTPDGRSPAPAPSPAPALRVFEVPSWGNGAPTVLIDLPAAAKMEHRQGPDFDVTYFTLRSGARMGIYVGHNPNPSHPPGAQSLKGTFGSVPVNWYCWEKIQDGAAAYTCETVVDGLFRNPGPPPAKAISLPPGKAPAPPPAPPSSSGVESLVLHIWATGNRAEVEMLRAYAAKLQLGSSVR